MRFAGIFVVAAGLMVGGCKSAHIDATVSNRTGGPLTLIEVDYPSASFGTQALGAGQDFHYRFKVLGSGVASVQWTDAGGHDHKSSGPSLGESDQGLLTIVFGPSGDVVWSEQFGGP
jgi:hypothetical protein